MKPRHTVKKPGHGLTTMTEGNMTDYREAVRFVDTQIHRTYEPYEGLKSIGRPRSTIESSDVASDPVPDVDAPPDLVTSGFVRFHEELKEYFQARYGLMHDSTAVELASIMYQAITFVEESESESESEDEEMREGI